MGCDDLGPVASPDDDLGYDGRWEEPSDRKTRPVPRSAFWRTERFSKLSLSRSCWQGLQARAEREAEPHSCSRLGSPFSSRKPMFLCAQAHSLAKADMCTQTTHTHTHAHSQDTSLGAWLLAVLFTEVPHIWKALEIYKVLNKHCSMNM